MSGCYNSLRTRMYITCITIYHTCIYIYTHIVYIDRIYIYTHNMCSVHAVVIFVWVSVVQSIWWTSIYYIYIYILYTRICMCMHVCIVWHKTLFAMCIRMSALCVCHVCKRLQSPPAIRSGSEDDLEWQGHTVR